MNKKNIKIVEFIKNLDKIKNSTCFITHCIICLKSENEKDLLSNEELKELTNCIKTLNEIYITSNNLRIKLKKNYNNCIKINTIEELLQFM